MKAYSAALALAAVILLFGCGKEDDVYGEGDADGAEETQEAQEDEEAAEDESAEAEEEAEETLKIVKFRFPLANAEGNYDKEYVFYFDRDPVVHEGIGTALCTNYNGDHFPNCYDEHRGTDYLLYGGFDEMDKATAFVYAAADGEVIKTVDGNYDRCHIDASSYQPGGISCDGNPIKANYIEIKHEDGYSTLYYHLKKGSLLVKEGDKVKCGQKLANVGSSGISSAPHLHFQVENPEGTPIDPYAAPDSDEISRWVEQDSGNALPAEKCQETK